MGMIVNDIDDVVSALIHSEGRSASKVARRLIERGLKLLFDEDEIGIHDVIVPSELDGRYKVRTHLALADDTTTIRADKLGAMEGTLRLAAETFDEYAMNHYAKEPPQDEKAERNVRMASACYEAIGVAYAPPTREPRSLPADAPIGSMAAWEADVKRTMAPEPAPTAPLKAVESLSAFPAPIDATVGIRELIRDLWERSLNGDPAKSLSLDGEDRIYGIILTALGWLKVEEVSDVIAVGIEARLWAGIKPKGAIDLPVEVAEITGNVSEGELAARYCEGKVKAIDSAIAKRDAPQYEMTCSWEESYGHAAMTLRAMAQEFRQGLHIPTVHGEARIIPYNEDRSTGISHRVSLDTFFDDVHARNVQAGWWNDITTGQPKKRSVGELFMLMVTELAEAYDAYVAGSKDDKLPEYPGVGVELGDLLIRVGDFAGALAAGRIVGFTRTRNPGDDMFREVRTIADRYEAIRKTPEAVGDVEEGDFLPEMTVGKMVDGKLAYNATRADHKIENRLKDDGKRT